jgi:hypothetical protein
MSPETELPKFNNWVNSLVPAVTDITTDFRTGELFITFVQALERSGPSLPVLVLRPARNYWPSNRTSVADWASKVYPSIRVTFSGDSLEAKRQTASTADPTRLKNLEAFLEALAKLKGVSIDDFRPVPAPEATSTPAPPPGTSIPAKLCPIASAAPPPAATAAPPVGANARLAEFEQLVPDYIVKSSEWFSALSARDYPAVPDGISAKIDHVKSLVLASRQFVTKLRDRLNRVGGKEANPTLSAIEAAASNFERTVSDLIRGSSGNEPIRPIGRLQILTADNKR